jgi:hypothetical protein
MDSSASSGGVEAERLWAERVSRRLLEPVGSRWRHTVGVAERARAVGAVLGDGDADLLLAAAFLHDIGYAPELAQTGFHPVDGARFVRAAGHERLAGLVAYHSGADAEAGERGLVRELSEFEDERSLLSRALTYCDLTTDSDGRRVDADERLAEIRERHGPSSPGGQAVVRCASALLEDVRRVEAILMEKGESSNSGSGYSAGGGDV